MLLLTHSLMALEAVDAVVAIVEDEVVEEPLAALGVDLDTDP